MSDSTATDVDMVQTFNMFSSSVFAEWRVFLRPSIAPHSGRWYSCSSWGGIRQCGPCPDGLTVEISKKGALSLFSFRQDWFVFPPLRDAVPSDSHKQCPFAAHSSSACGSWRKRRKILHQRFEIIRYWFLIFFSTFSHSRLVVWHVYFCDWSYRVWQNILKVDRRQRNVLDLRRTWLFR